MLSVAPVDPARLSVLSPQDLDVERDGSVAGYPLPVLCWDGDIGGLS